MSRVLHLRFGHPDQLWNKGSQRLKNGESDAKHPSLLEAPVFRVRFRLNAGMDVPVRMQSLLDRLISARKSGLILPFPDKEATPTERQPD